MDPVSTEEKIIRGALAEFAEHGYEGARIDRIAKRAGVNKAMIYYHHKGKEKLYEKIIRDTAEGIYAFMNEKIKSDERSIDGLERMMFHFMDYFNGIDLDFMRIIMREISAGGKYLRKIFLPYTLMPFMEIFTAYIGDLKKRKMIREIDPMYTFFQIAGGIIYFNMLRIMLDGTVLYPAVFGENYQAKFKKNMSLIVREGIAKRNGKGKGEV